MFLLALLLQHLDETLWLKCHIQWLYLAVHGCKTYLNLNLNQGIAKREKNAAHVPSYA
jgi:hypothetical protein